MERFVSTCMVETIGITLERIARLRHPVPRSCHVGNNTMNNFGWLALGRNTRLALYDHTLYGVDSNCLPWAILGDNGTIHAAFNTRGQLDPAAEGCSVRSHLKSIPRRHKSHLNYALPAQFKGYDLFNYHWRLLSELSQLMNDSVPTLDSRDIVQASDLIKEISSQAQSRGQLHKLFDRWVLSASDGTVLMHKIADIVADSTGLIRVRTTDGREIFRGHLDRLLDQLLLSLSAVTAKIVKGVPLPKLSYPWFHLSFSYLIPALVEHRDNCYQTEFWHAGGSSSSYYVHDPSMADAFEQQHTFLADCGFLPRSARLHLIPTFGCQFFASSPDSLIRLENLLEIWQQVLRHSRTDVRNAVSILGHTTRPLAIAQSFANGLPTAVTERLRNELKSFNELDPCRLPIAHSVALDHPTYNKYGLSQQHFVGVRPYFPTRFAELTWGDVELLTKTMAYLVQEESESPEIQTSQTD